MTKNVTCNGCVVSEEGSASIPIECECVQEENLQTISMRIDGVDVTVDAAPILKFFNSLEVKDGNTNSTS